MLPTTGGSDEEIRYTIALEGAAQAQADIEKLTAGVREFNTQLATAIQLVKELMEQFSGKGGAAPQLPEFQKAFENQVQSQSNISLGVWEKAVQEIEKMNLGVATSSNLINTMTASLIAAEQADRQFEAGLARKTSTLAGFGTQVTDTTGKIDQLTQKLGTELPELKTPQPAEVVQPKIETENLERTAGQVEQLAQAETTLANATQQVAQPMATANQATKGMGDEAQNSAAKLLTFDEQVAQARIKLDELAKSSEIGSNKFAYNLQGVMAELPFPLDVWQKAYDELLKVSQATQTVRASAEQLPVPFEQVGAATTKFGADTANVTADVNQFNQQVQALLAQLVNLQNQYAASPTELPKFEQQLSAMAAQADPRVWNAAAEQFAKLQQAARDAAAINAQLAPSLQPGTEATKAQTSAVQSLTAGLRALDEQAKTVKTDVVDLNKQLETTTPKAVEVPAAQVVPAVTVPVETAAATTAVDNLIKEEDKLAAASQQLVQPLEQVNQASKDAQGGSQNLADGLKVLDDQAKVTKQGVQDLNKAIESQPEKVAVAPEVTAPAITNVPTQAVASLDALDQEQQKVKTSADALAQSETVAGQAAQGMGTQAASAGSGGVTAFKDQVDQAKVAIQALMDKFGGGQFTTTVAAQFEAAKIKSPLDPAAWDQALQQLVAYKGAAEGASEASKNIEPVDASKFEIPEIVRQVQDLTLQIDALANATNKPLDKEALFSQFTKAGFSVEAINKAFQEAEAAGVKFGSNVAVIMRQDQIEINRAKEALRELAAIKMTSPLKAAEMPEFQALNFNPATVTAAMYDLGTSFDKTAVRKDAFKVNLQTLWATFKQGATPIQGIKNAFNLLVQGFSTGGGLISAVIGGVFGFSLIGIVNGVVSSIGNLIQSLNQAAEASLAFLDSTFKLEIGLRDAQRKGFDATRDELVKFSKDFKEKYPMFSNVAIRKGLADMIFFTKELGVSAKDSFAMFDSSAALAIATGKEVSEVMRMIALAASSGYSEGLQRMGLNINKVTITEKAHAMGVKESYMAMNQEQRASALLALVMEQTNGIIDDAAKKQYTLAGAAEAAAAKQEDAGVRIGKAWLPFKTFFDNIKAEVENRIAGILETMTDFVYQIIGMMNTVTILAAKITSGKAFGRNMADVIAESINEGFDLAAKQTGVKEFAFDATAEVTLNLSEAGLSDEDKQKVYDSVDGFIETLEKSITDYQDSQVEAAQKYQDDLVKIEQDGLEKRAQLDEEYAQKQRDIEFDLQQDIAKARLDLQRDLADINLKAAQDSEKAKADAKQKELDLEKEYADKVAKLQRDLEFDLEEAVRARDATAVRRLKRQYGKDLTELDIQKQQDKQQIQHDLQLRLQEIQQRRALDIQQRQIDFAQKIADLQAQAALERQQALDNYNKDLADLQKSLAQQRAERKKAYNDQLIDLHDAFMKRLKMASEALAKEVGMNAQAAQDIAKYLIALYGPNGVFQKVYDYMIAYITKGKNEIIANFNSSNLGISEQAEGGDYLVKKPTLFLAGEKGAEEAHFWPVNKPIPMPTNAMTNVSSLEQSLRIRVDLGPDLIAKIVDRSLDEFADVMVRSG